MPHHFPVRDVRSCASTTIATFVFVVLGSSACGGRQVIPEPVAPRPLGRDLPVFRSQSAEPSQRRADSTFTHPRDSLSLRDAVALALLQSPDLAAFAWETRAREARLLQAGALPNPALDVLSEDLGASTPLGGGAPLLRPQTTIQLSQLVELGRKRVRRRELAARTRDLAAWDYEAARIDVLTGVTHAFIDVLAAQALVALTERTTELVSQVQLSVAVRVVAGVVSPVEETRADVALATARVESTRAARMLDASRQRLAAYWGATESRFTGAIGALGLTATIPSLESLAARLSANPDLARWASETAQRRSVLASERANRIPDLSLTAGYRRVPNLESEAFVVGGAFTLPLFDRNRGAIEEAESRVAKAFEQRRAASARVATALAEAYGALTGSHAEVTALRSTVLPGSQQTFEAISEGYRLGRFSYLDFLDAQRTLIAASTQHLRALAEFNKAVADVERLIGAPLDTPTDP